MSINSREKGARGEREFAEFMRDYGIAARRGQQFSGGADSPDVVHELDGYHIEVKRVERGNPYDWFEQAVHDTQHSLKVPVVAHRRNNKPWLVILSAEAFMEILLNAGNRPTVPQSVAEVGQPNSGGERPGDRSPERVRAESEAPSAGTGPTGEVQAGRGTDSEGGA